MNSGRTLAQIAAARTDLSPQQVAHCEALVKDLGLLADLAFADLVLWLPVWNQGGFVAAAQVRPTTAATRLPSDMLGTFAPRGRHPELDMAWTPAGTGLIHPRVDPLVPAGDEAVGVAMARATPAVAVLTRSSAASLRARGALERAYLRAADELFAMIRVGSFPLSEGGPGFGLAGAEARVGDGFIRLDPAGRVVFASPNASSAFRRLGVATELAGSQLASVAGRVAQRSGSHDASLAMVAGGRLPGESELATANANVTMRSIPLSAGQHKTGALILVRDVTELRRRERALVSKDATIREIHHRVKNNLQTVAALLRMQARRLSDPGAVAALVEAERRVAAIAVVHDLLAHEVSEDVEFDAVADRLLVLVSQTATSDLPRPVRRIGTFGKMPAGSATALSMALVEVLANALEHGAGDVELHVCNDSDLDGSELDDSHLDIRELGSGESRVSEARGGEARGIEYRSSESRSSHTAGTELVIRVSDAGAGFEAGLDIKASPRLGLRIVTALVCDELQGRLQWSRVADRTVVEMRIPVRD